MPKLWNETIAAHREDVRDAILDAVGALVREGGLLSVTMSRLAQEAGIGRATLYKYFSDVESVLDAWHQRHVAAHVSELSTLAMGRPPEARLQAVLEGYSRICYHRGRHHLGELGLRLHRGDAVSDAEHRLADLFEDLVAAAAATGAVRDDVPPAELAAYCLHSLAAAGVARSDAAARRLVGLVLAGMGPPA